MKDEYYHIGSEGEGEAGPFDTIEAAQADALAYLHESFGIPEVKIVKVVAVSDTKVSYDTQWRT